MASNPKPEQPAAALPYARGMRAPAAASLALALPLLAASCGWLAAGTGPNPDGPQKPATHDDAGALDDGGAGLDASTPVDAGTQDSGALPDGGPEPDDGGATDGGRTDAGRDDAGPSDAGEGDAGHLDDAGLDAGPPLNAGDAAILDAGRDGGPPDAGPPSPFVVLASGTATYTAEVELDEDQLQQLDTVVLFLARPQALPTVDLPGNWSGATYASRSLDDERVVGASRHLQIPPADLLAAIDDDGEDKLVIETDEDEVFSYALIGVVGLGDPDRANKRGADSAASQDCGGEVAQHTLNPPSEAYRAVVGLAHLGAPVSAVEPGRVLVREEPLVGPALLVHHVRGEGDEEIPTTVCLADRGPFVSVAKYFEVP